VRVIRSPQRYRRFLRHIVLAVVFALSSAMFLFLFRAGDMISRVSFGTAYAGLLLTGAALLPGPWNVLRGRPTPVSFGLRRDIGIWAGIAALVHTAVGLNVHFRGRAWLYFLDQHHHLRTDKFGFANYTGLVAALLFAVLLAISNDVSLRRLGSVKWKSLQRWTYAAVVLTAAHAIAYQYGGKRPMGFLLLMYGTLGAVVLFQLAGVTRRKRQRTTGAEKSKNLATQAADSPLRSD
jgi:methionine sulfoxide reductase heme-binding subunit